MPDQPLSAQTGWSEIHRLHAERLPAIVLHAGDRIEEGHITEIDDSGFRIGPLGHWVWWQNVERVGEKKR